MTFGRHAEDAACLFLENRGYQIIERNYRTRFAEIDIIAIHGDTLVFAEVKARKSLRYGSPRESVGSVKQKKIIAGAMQYLREKQLGDNRIRFDVITILQHQWKFHMDIIPNAFQGISRI